MDFTVTKNEKDALIGYKFPPSAQNPFLTKGDADNLGLKELSLDTLAALNAANTPNAENPIATIADLPTIPAIPTITIPLTLAELQALQLADLPIGQQYYVTDKNWLLYANTVNTLKPVSGSLHIFNGETLPTGVEPDILLIDTGITTEVTIDLVIPTNYYYKNGIVDLGLITEDDVFLYSGLLYVTSIPIGASNAIGKYSFMPISSGTAFDPFTITSISITENAEPGCRAILEFHRSELAYPIPVPHIVSAESNTLGTEIVLTFDENLNESSVIEANNNGAIYTMLDDFGIGNSFVLSSPNQITLTMIEANILFGDVYTINTDSNSIKNTWGGLLAEVVDYPVVNNVPEPPPVPHIASITKVYNYGRIRIAFDEPMNDISLNKADMTFYQNGTPNNLSINSDITRINTEEFYIDTFLLFFEGDHLDLSIASGNIKSVLGGVLEAVEHYPVQV